MSNSLVFANLVFIVTLQNKITTDNTEGIYSFTLLLQFRKLWLKEI
jgi:hypothetical protein